MSTHADPSNNTAVVVMGVAGSGKTTVVAELAKRLHWPTAEADNFHTEENVAKMHSGIPLTDEDRGPWLQALRDWISDERQDVLITCSALRRRYRDVLRTADAHVRFLHLDGPPEVLQERISARKDHYMPPALLQSQIDTLEELEPDEDGITLDIRDEPEKIAQQAIAHLGLEP